LCRSVAHGDSRKSTEHSSHRSGNRSADNRSGNATSRLSRDWWQVRILLLLWGLFVLWHDRDEYSKGESRCKQMSLRARDLYHGDAQPRLSIVMMNGLAAVERLPIVLPR